MKQSLANTPDVWDQVWDTESDREFLQWNIERDLRLMRWGYFKRHVEKAFGNLTGLSSIELGAGRGTASLYLASLGVNVTLVDWSERALESSAKLFGEFGIKPRLVKANILQLPSQEIGNYDLSVSVGVAEHFVGAERQAVIGSHAAVLKSGGLSLISVPNSMCVPYSSWMYITKKRGKWKFGLEVPFAQRELENLARQAELEPVETVGSSLAMAFDDFWVWGYFAGMLTRISGIKPQKRRTSTKLGNLSPTLMLEQERLWDHHMGYLLNLIARRR